MTSIAIIGGGAGGTLALVQLVRKAAQPISVTLYDARGDFARGVAYSTQRREHVLNVRAHRMGAFPDTPDHFFRWLATPQGKEAQRRWCDVPIAATDFAPRGLYGDYLSALLAEALEEAERKRITVQPVQADVTAARWNGNTFTLETTNGTQQPDGVILACGTQSPPAQGGVIEAWEWFKTPPGSGDDARLKQAKHVVLIGSGLTMVDSALSLQRIGYAGKITALSRHAALPTPHYEQDPAPYPPWRLTLSQDAPRSARGLLHVLRAEVAAAAHKGSGWREVVDSLRAVTPALWQNLSPEEQRKCFARLFTLWNVHRHRMAPHIHRTLTDMMQSGQLTLSSGYVTGVAQRGENMEVNYRHEGAPRMLAADAVIRCTGPAYDITRSAHPLLKQLVTQGLIAPSAAGAGIASSPAYSARGPAEGRLFAMGALLVGDWLECTAMPELRAQAADIASIIWHPARPAVTNN